MVVGAWMWMVYLAASCCWVLFFPRRTWLKQALACEYLPIWAVQLTLKSVDTSDRWFFLSVQVPSFYDLLQVPDWVCMKKVRHSRGKLWHSGHVTVMPPFYVIDTWRLEFFLQRLLKINYKIASSDSKVGKHSLRLMSDKQILFDTKGKDLFVVSSHLVIDMGVSINGGSHK